MLIGIRFIRFPVLEVDKDTHLPTLTNKQTERQINKQKETEKTEAEYLESDKENRDR